MAPELTKAQQELLHRLVFKKRMFLGRDRIFQYLQKHHPNAGISRRQVMDFLKKQEIAQLFKQPKKTKDIRNSVMSRPFQQMGVDLVDMQSFEHQKQKYILTGIDLFSKMAWAEAMPNKEEKTVSAAMGRILKRIGKKVSTVRSDRGSEFNNQSFRKVLEKYGSKQVLSMAGKPQSNGQVERFNGVLKRMIKMAVTQDDDQNWPSFLSQLVSNYNATESRVTGMSPDEMVERDNSYVNDSVKKKIEKEVLPKNDHIDRVLKVGDEVRLKVVTDKNQKKNMFWTQETFKIWKVHVPRKKFSRPYYFVEDEEKRYTDKLYPADVQLVTDIENPVAAPEKTTVSKIMDVRVIKRQPQLLVKFVDEREPRWQKLSDMVRDVPKMVRAFLKKKRPALLKKLLDA